MGIALSWLAVQGKSPESVLNELGLRATGGDRDLFRGRTRDVQQRLNMDRRAASLVRNA